MFLVFDIGATKSRFGLSTDKKQLDQTVVFPTPKQFSDALLLFRNVKERWKLNKKAKRIAGGAPGPLNQKKTMLVHSPHRPDWSAKPLRRELRKIFKAPVYLENDTALVGLGEARVGAGRGYGIVAYVTISTGVNGARIVEGRIDRAAYGFEIGHQILSIESPGQAKTWEELVSGAALQRFYGRRPEDIDDAKVWRGVEQHLAYGLNNVVVHWSPDVVVLGGGIMQSRYINIERIAVHLKRILKIFPVRPALRKASLGDEGGLYGALAYLNLKSNENEHASEDS